MDPSLFRDLPKRYPDLIRQFLTLPPPSIPAQLETSTSCACICVVKDEAPYIHEYIHHHLYFGFSPILILTNRITDSTIEILSRISQNYSTVIRHDIDWIDAWGQPGRMQPVGIAYAIHLLRQSPAARYALICDADEFWFPTDFSTTIGEWLSDLPCFDQVSLCWAVQGSHESPFQQPFYNQRVNYTRQIKSIVDLFCAIEEPDLHQCKLLDDAGNIDSFGNAFESVSPEKRFLYAKPLESQSAYILHRMQRSEPEYLATLLRGNPHKPGQLKLNRSGYSRHFGKINLSIPAGKLDRYHHELDKFIHVTGISPLLEQARLHRLERASYLAKNYRDMYAKLPDIETKKLFLRNLSGTTINLELTDDGLLLE